VLLSRAQEPWDGPNAACLAALGLLVTGAGKPWDRPDDNWLALLGLLVSRAGDPRNCSDAAWLLVLGLMVSGARDPRDCPDAVWLVVLGLLVSVSGEPWDSSEPAWFPVLGPASSELGLEIGRGSRKVKGTAPQAQGRRGQSGVPAIQEMFSHDGNLMEKGRWMSPCCPAYSRCRVSLLFSPALFPTPLSS